jgi:hypothetical protein
MQLVYRCKTVGWGTGFAASAACFLACMFGGGLFTRDAAVIAQLRAVAVPVCAAVVGGLYSC